ncbi:MAG: hypothetical protein IPM54_11510 [Polyangiaceae bacterium]|nr:hypothetical protein [Polyangiaceae bacterium]
MATTTDKNVMMENLIESHPYMESASRTRHFNFVATELEGLPFYSDGYHGVAPTY